MRMHASKVVSQAQAAWKWCVSGVQTLNQKSCGGMPPQSRNYACGKRDAVPRPIKLRIKVVRRKCVTNPFTNRPQFAASARQSRVRNVSVQAVQDGEQIGSKGTGTEADENLLALRVGP
jgi:hypothetical protein